MLKIIFTDTMGIDEIYHPKPSEECLPDWFKQMPSYLGNGKVPTTGVNKTNATIKKCLPVFDAIANGYMIFTYVDVFVSQRNDMPYYEWSDHNAIEFHAISQADKHPEASQNDFAKWVNPFGITTPKGYSTLFLPPMHQKNQFVIFEGVVDTDKFNLPVNFPFVLKDKNFTGIIPAGTPLAQVVPFKRESWKMEMGQEEHRVVNKKQLSKLKSKFYEGYKNLYRQKKEFK